MSNVATAYSKCKLPRIYLLSPKRGNSRVPAGKKGEKIHKSPKRVAQDVLKQQHGQLDPNPARRGVNLAAPVIPQIRGWTDVVRTPQANVGLGATLCFVAGATGSRLAVDFWPVWRRHQFLRGPVCASDGAGAAAHPAGCPRARCAVSRSMQTSADPTGH